MASPNHMSLFHFSFANLAGMHPLRYCGNGEAVLELMFAGHSVFELLGIFLPLVVSASIQLGF